MPRVRYLGGGGYYIRGGPEFDEKGDEVDVTPDTAERLTARDDFEPVDEGVEDDADAGEEDGAEANDDGTEFDAEAWLDQGYQERADRVESGELDEHLAKVLQVETSETVKDAVEQRRDSDQ